MIRVVKVGGRAQGNPRLGAALAQLAQGGISKNTSTVQTDSLCIVHGGGDEVSTLQRRLGLVPRFSGGRRVTSKQDLEVVRMVLSGTINKRLVALLLGQGVRAVGISGEDAMLLTAHTVDAERMGRVGGAVAVKPEILFHLLAGGFLPVISPLARDADARSGIDSALNVNGDDAAAALAVALSADELVLVADVPGVIDDGAVRALLDHESANALIANGVAAAGMAAKLEAAVHALQGGVNSVRITGLEGLNDVCAGTRIVLSPSSARVLQ